MKPRIFDYFQIEICGLRPIGPPQFWQNFEIALSVAWQWGHFDRGAFDPGVSIVTLSFVSEIVKTEIWIWNSKSKAKDEIELTEPRKLEILKL